jgi:hypothetical protein
MIRGSTALIAHIGWPTHTFKSPMIYNPYFEQAGVDAVVVPMGCQAEQFAAFLKAVFSLENIRGALITMPHKMSTVALLDEATPTVKIAGSCNAVRRSPDGRLQGDMFDGEGFVRGLRRKGCKLEGARAFVVGCGGVGSAIAASLAAAGVEAIALFAFVHETAVDLGFWRRGRTGWRPALGCGRCGGCLLQAPPLVLERLQPQAHVRIAGAERRGTRENVRRRGARPRLEQVRHESLAVDRGARGGEIARSGELHRPAARQGESVDTSTSHLGFRCVVTVGASSP